MFGIHSLEYDGLGSYLYLFAALEDQSRWLSWDRVVEIADEVDVPTVPVEARMQVLTSSSQASEFCLHIWWLHSLSCSIESSCHAEISYPRVSLSLETEL